MLLQEPPGARKPVNDGSRRVDPVVTTVVEEDELDRRAPRARRIFHGVQRSRLRCRRWLTAVDGSPGSKGVGDGREELVAAERYGQVVTSLVELDGYGSRRCARILGERSFNGDYGRDAVSEITGHALHHEG